MISEKLLRVNEVAEILRVSQMTVIRWCNSGHLPCVKIGVSRRIRESDLDYILDTERGPQKLKVESKLVYEGPPASECGFDCEADEEERRRILKEECEAAKIQIEAIKTKRAASIVKLPEPIFTDFGESTGMFPSGFDIK